MNAHQSAPTLIVAAEAARRLSISIRSFWKLVEQGELSVIRVTPRRVAVDEADLAAYVASRRERGPARQANRVERRGSATRAESLRSR